MAQWFKDTYPDMEWLEPDNGEFSKRDIRMIKWLEENLKWKELDDEESDSNSFNRYNRWIDNTMDVATEAGQLDIVQYLDDHPSHKPTCDLIFNAAENGHMDILQWLHERESTCSESAIGVYGGHLDAAQWLYRQISSTTFQNTHLHSKRKRTWKHEHETIFSIDVTAEYWTLEMVQWLHVNRPTECTTRATDRAAVNGKLDIVKWLHANRSEGCTAKALKGAIRKGRLEIVRWLLKHRNSAGSRFHHRQWTWLLGVVI